jgi:hypothetical protein
MGRERRKVESEGKVESRKWEISMKEHCIIIREKYRRFWKEEEKEQTNLHFLLRRSVHKGKTLLKCSAFSFNF